MRPSREHWRAVATAAAAAVIIIGLVAIVRRRDNESQPKLEAAPPNSELSTTSFPDRGRAFVGVSAPPLLLMSAAGWTLNYIDDSTLRRQLFVAVDSVTGFAGSSFIVRPSELGVTGDSLPAMPGTESLAAKGIDGTIIGPEGERQIEWKAGDRLLTAQAKNLSDADAVAIVNSLSIAPDGTISSDDVPAHMVALTPAEFAGLDRYVTYSWTNDDESKTIEATLGGAENIGASLPGQAILESIAFGPRTAYFDAGVMRVTWLDGFWHWTLTGTGYAERSDFLDDALTVTSTDRATWEKQIAGHAVMPSERAAVVSEILSDIPTPSGFDPQSIAGEDTAQARYQVITRVTAAVWCGWAQQWDSALSAGDDELAEAASAAIASSENWDALIEIADQGGWSGLMWDASRRVAEGDRTAWSQSYGGFGCAMWSSARGVPG